MIEPLRMPFEQNLPLEILRPVFCEKCLQLKQMKHNPNIATKFCCDCVNAVGTSSSNSRSYGIFLCRVCEENDHKLASTKDHNRQMLVVGPGLRKKVIVRGDGRNFPKFLDNVKVKVSSKVYNNGRKIHSESAQYIHFTSGLSGKSVHIQLLGAKNLQVGDLDGSSDPFVSFSYCGKVISTTRVRPRTLNPRWNNETFIVPMENPIYPSVNSTSSMTERDKDLVRLEVFDHDYVSQNDFLGHIEMSRDKLSALAVITSGQAIDVPLTMKEHRGVVSLKLGWNEEEGRVSLQMCGAEGIDPINPKDLSNPYAKIWMRTETQTELLIGTTSTDIHTVNPIWGNIFHILDIAQFLHLESSTYSPPPNPTTAVNQSKKTDNPLSSFSFDELDLLLLSSNPSKPFIRIEIWSYRNYYADVLLGETLFPFEIIRKMIPNLPSPQAISEVKRKKTSSISISLGRKPSPVMFWSEIYPFVVTKHSSKFTLDHRKISKEEEEDNIDVGSLILRLLPSNRGQVVLGLDEGVRQMTLGETSQIKCRYDYAYNNYSMGGSIPPRSNIIFRVELLEINGKGKWGMMFRQFIRLKRVIVLLSKLLYKLCFKESIEKNSEKSSLKRKTKESISNKFLQIIGLRSVKDDSDSEDLDEDEEEEENMDTYNNNNNNNQDNEQYLEEGSLLDESSLESQQKIKPDPRIRKFLNQSVKTGNKLLWNYNPKQKQKKNRSSHRRPPVVIIKDEDDNSEEQKDLDSDSDSLGDDENDENEDAEEEEEEQLIN